MQLQRRLQSAPTMCLGVLKIKRRLLLGRECERGDSDIDAVRL
jgi:hypothetical protein